MCAAVRGELLVQPSGPRNGDEENYSWCVPCTAGTLLCCAALRCAVIRVRVAAGLAACQGLSASTTTTGCCCSTRARRAAALHAPQLLGAAQRSLPHVFSPLKVVSSCLPGCPDRRNRGALTGGNEPGPAGQHAAQDHGLVLHTLESALT